MKHIYYEPFSDKIYISRWELGSTTLYLHNATDGKFHCPWHLERDDTKFFYMGALDHEI